MDYPNNFNFSSITLLILIFLINQSNTKLLAQSDITAWGNIRGIRVDGELMKFETSLTVIKNNWIDIIQTAKEEQEPTFKREGSKAIITSEL